MSRIDDPNGDPIPGILERLNALEKQNPLESGSVSAGRLRFIGGLLRVDSGGRVEIVGTLQVDGTSTVTGQFNVNGPFTFAGNGSITGELTITGPVTISGDVDLTGLMRVTGDVEIIGDGKITIGGIVIGEGKIKAGGMTINPDVNGGQIEFGSGRTINAGSNYLGIYDGDRFVLFNAAGVTVYAGGSSISFSSEGIRATGLTNHTDMEGRRWVTVDGGGLLGQIDPAFGGPGAGQFEYPFPESTITYGFRPPDRPTHDGLDMAGPGVTGQMIPSAARGVVSFAGGSGGTTGYGYYVIVDHGIVNGEQVETLYGHMKTSPIVSVGQTVQKGEFLGPVGNTGNSFGDHLHWEVRVNGSPVDPQIFMQRYTG